MARRLGIEARFKEIEISSSIESDFTLIDKGEMAAAELFEQSNWSPYCFDADKKETLFVRIPQEVDLSKVAFMYADQFNDAIEAARVSNAELIGAAKIYQTPPMAIIFSIGRCGTTLANHVLNASPEMYCLSEPTAVEQLGSYLGEDRAQLGSAYARQLFAGRARRSTSVLGIKLRSMVLFHATAFCDAMPDANKVFMYRDAIGWANSFIDMASRMKFSDQYTSLDMDFAWPTLMQEDADIGRQRYPDLAGDACDPGTFWGHAWARHLEVYADLKAGGLDLHPIRYNEFNRDRLAGTRELLQACGLGPEAAPDALAAFENDSQKGTMFGQVEKPKRMTDANKDALRAALAKHPGFEDAELILD